MLPLLFHICLFLVVYATRDEVRNFGAQTSLLLLVEICELFVLVSEFTVVGLQMNTFLDLLDGFFVLLLFAVSLTHQVESFGGFFLAYNYGFFAIVYDILVLVQL